MYTYAVSIASVSRGVVSAGAKGAARPSSSESSEPERSLRRRPGRDSDRALPALRRVQLPVLAMSGSVDETVLDSRTDQVPKVVHGTLARAQSLTTVALTRAGHLCAGCGEEVV